LRGAADVWFSQSGEIMRPFLLFSAIFAVVCVAFAQESAKPQEPTKFAIRNGKGMTGSEVFSIRKTASGYEVDGETRMQQDGKDQATKQTAVLHSDWTLASYRAETKVPNGAIVVEATTDDTLVVLKTTYPGGGNREAGLKRTPKSFLLENFVPSQLQIAVKANPAGGTFDAIVPTSMSHFDAKLAKVGTGEGTLAGKQIKLTKYTLDGGGSQFEIWTDEASGDLMRMAVPSIKVEYVRDGFKMPEAKEENAAPAQPAANPK
jgi:hypothetical protein